MFAQSHFQIVADGVNTYMRMALRQKRVMIEFFDDGFYDLVQNDEIDYVLIGIQRPMNLDRQVIIVPMQCFASATLERDEMRGAKSKSSLATRMEKLGMDTMIGI